MSPTSITFGLKYQARVLRAQITEKEKSQWYVATNCLREENEVRLVEYDSTSESIKTVDAFVHPQEVWDLTPNPTRSDQFFTVQNKDGVYSVVLWQSENGSQDLVKVGEMQGLESRARRILWGASDSNRAISIDEGNIKCWDMSKGSVESAASLSTGDLQQLWCGTQSRSDPNRVCTVSGNGFCLWDMKSMQKVGELEGAHEMPIRNVDLSPANDYQILTCGDDCVIRQWDSRNLVSPTMKLTGHSHWIWNCAYNPSYPNLLLSSSSDSLVVLWSNAPLGCTPESLPSSPVSVLDGRLTDYDDHEDSVYGLAWSEVDPWTFASLSYDGRVVVNKVPSEVKYKILI